MQIKKDYTKMIEQFEKMEKEKQAAIGKILRREMPRSFTERADEIKKSSRLFPRQS